MGTTVWQNAFRLLLISAAGWLAASQIVQAPVSLRNDVLFFCALVFLVDLLRVRHRDGEVGFEAGAVFPAIVLFANPALVIIPAMSGLLLGRLARGWFHGDRDFVGALTQSSRSTLSYAVGLFVFVAVSGRSGDLASRALGYLALLASWIVVSHALGWLERAMGQSGTDGLLAQTRVQARTLLLITPMVAVEILVYPYFGVAGLIVAFLPVLLVAYVLKSEADSELRNAALSRHNRELSLLRDSSSLLLSAEGDEETLRRLTRMLSTILPMKACAVVATMNTMAVYRFGECQQTDQTIVRWTSAAGLNQELPHEPILNRGDRRALPLFDGDATQLVIGIQTVHMVFGVLIFETEPGVAIEEETLNLISLLVNQTAVSLQDQLLKSDLRQQTEQLESNRETLETILEVSRTLIGNYDVNAILSRVANALRSTFGFEIVVIGLLDPKRDVFVSRAQAGLDDIWDEVRRRHIPAPEIMQLMRPANRISQSYFIPYTKLWGDDYFLYLRKDGEGLRFQDWSALDMLLVPLLDGERVIGYISVREDGDGIQPTTQKMQSLEIFASQSVAALQSAGQYEEIHRLTQLDSLTGAYNHRYFQDTLRKEIYRHQRLNHGLAIAMIDIDNFKSMNDTHGHPAGDAVLRGLVDELCVNVRDIDVVCRYGGEEFAIILPETPADKAHDVMSRLRACVAAREFPIDEKGTTVRITVSSGVAVYPQDGADPLELVGKADAALYCAKKAGKNQVVMA